MISKQQSIDVCVCVCVCKYFIQEKKEKRRSRSLMGIDGRLTINPTGYKGVYDDTVLITVEHNTVHTIVDTELHNSGHEGTNKLGDRVEWQLPPRGITS